MTRLTKHSSLLFTAFSSWGKRNRATQPDLGEGRKTMSSMNWPKCCPSRRQSHPSWTKRRSSDSPSHTWSSETSPSTVFRRGHHLDVSHRKVRNLYHLLYTSQIISRTTKKPFLLCVGIGLRSSSQYIFAFTPKVLVSFWLDYLKRFHQCVDANLKLASTY